MTTPTVPNPDPATPKPQHPPEPLPTPTAHLEKRLADLEDRLNAAVNDPERQKLLGRIDDLEKKIKAAKAAEEADDEPAPKGKGKPFFWW